MRCDVYKKLAYLKKLTRVNNSRILRIKNDIKRDFQIFISVPLGGPKLKDTLREKAP